MKTIKKNGANIKLEKNFDEETYSVLARPEYFPVQIKVPKNFILEATNIVGNPTFIDDENTAWSASGSSFYKHNLDTDESELFLDMKTKIPEVVRAVWMYKTKTINGNYNLIASVDVSQENNRGGRIYTSTDKGETWVKKLDLDEMGLPAHFRTSNVWAITVANTESIVVGSYGLNNVNPGVGEENGIWRSNDLGVTWVKIYEIPFIADSPTQRHIHALTISPNNGWIWAANGDGANTRKLFYSHNAIYNDTPDWQTVAEGEYGSGGWQPSGMVTTILGGYFGTDSGGGYPNGVLGYDLPDRTEMGKLGFKVQSLHEDSLQYIARRGARISGVEAYIPMHIGGGLSSKIFVTGDAGFSWHQATIIKVTHFQSGFSTPDKDGFVYGRGVRFKVSEWETVTKWVKGRFSDKVGYI
ncbi:MAG: sialidase family protein [Fermentimonas sp.]|nr:sialidase family protein [Fermentimonas sp.]MDD4696939.1 sialidase family protein [Fermentimonas sp.]